MPIFNESNGHPLGIDPFMIQRSRWFALQSVARERKIIFFPTITYSNLTPENVDLCDLTILCDTLEAVLHSPRGK